MADEEQTTNLSKRCRERKPNFSETEISLLLEAACEHKDVINSTDNCASANKQREAAYKKITEKVNEATRREYGGCVERDWKEVRKKWSVEKGTALKIHNAKLAGSIQQKDVPEPSPINRLVIAILSGEAKVGSTDFRLGKRPSLDLFCETVLHSSQQERQSTVNTVSMDFDALSKYEHCRESTMEFQPADLDLKVVKTELNVDHLDPLHSFTLDEVTSLSDQHWEIKNKEISQENVLDNEGSSGESTVTSALHGTGKTRQRNQNFTDLEITTLLREVNKRRDVLFSRAQNSKWLNLKHQQWKQITQHVLKVGGSGIERKVEDVQKKWSNLKTLAERERQIVDRAKTKGCLVTLSVSPHTQQVLKILDGTLEDGPATEVEEVDFDAMLNLYASSSHNNVTLLPHTTTAESLPGNSPTTPVKRERKANFSHAEVMCLLEEMPKHYKTLGSKVRSSHVNRLKKRHWQTIADKVNMVSDGEVVRTWEDVQRKFKALKLATRNKAKTERGREPPSRDLPCEYEQLVQEILDGNSLMDDNSAQEDAFTPDDSDDGTKPEHEASLERSSGKDRTMSAEESECLISEVESLAGVLFYSELNNPRSHVSNDAWNQAWKIVTEKVNKLSHEGCGWKVSDLKEKWIEMQAEAEHYGNAVAQGGTDLAEPPYYHRISSFLNTLDSQKAVSQPGAQKGDAGSACCDFQPAVPLPAVPGQDQKISPMRTLETLPNLVEEQNTHSHSNNNASVKVKEEGRHSENSEDDDIIEDTEDPDYVPASFKPTEKNATTCSPSRLRKTINPKKISRLLQRAPMLPIQRRIRSPNFSEAEIQIMLDVYRQNKAVLRSRQQNKSINLKKLFVWQQMVNKLNRAAGPHTLRRTIPQVRKKLKDLHALVVRCHRKGSAFIRGRPPWLNTAVLEKLTTMLDIDATDTNSFEIYKDIAAEDDSNLERDAGSDNSRHGSKTKADISVVVQRHLDLIRHSCNQLQKLGVDAGALVFEDMTIMACGSQRLKHPTSRQHLEALLSESTLEEQSCLPQTADNWDIVTQDGLLNISGGTDTTAQRTDNPENTTTTLTQQSSAVSQPQFSEDHHNVDDSDDDRGDDMNGENLAVEEVSTIGASFDTEESDEAADVKDNIKATIQERSSDLESMLDVYKDELSEGDFTPVGFHLQQANSSKCVYTCNICQVSFPHLFLLVLHKQGHVGEEGDCEAGEEEREKTQDNTTGVLGKSNMEDTAHRPKGVDDVDEQKEEEDVDCSDGLNNQTEEHQASEGTSRHNNISRGCQRRFPCTFCGKQCFSDAHRNRHMLIHTGEKPYRCDVCGLRFTRNTSLTIHRRSHTDERPYACSLCDRGFCSSSNLLLHQRNEHGDIEKKSQKQESSIITGDGGDVSDRGDDGAVQEDTLSGDAVKYQTAEQQGHQGSRELSDYDAFGAMRQRHYPCETCGKRFLKSSHLKQHVLLHTGERPYRCDICGMCFTQSGSLTFHKQKHNRVELYACSQCNYATYYSRNMLSHRKKHHGLVMEKNEMQKKTKCEFCSKVFINTHTLEAHMRRHTGVKPFACDICSKRFSGKYNLQRHKERHLGLKSFQCEICGAKFTERGALKVHMRYHTGERPFKCDLCDEAFYVTSTLKIHRRRHTGERPFLCDLCGASFTQGGKLNVHRRKHTGEKPHKCVDCGEAFRDKQQLNVHSRKHTGIQPYTCGVCGKHLQKASHLAVHIRLHTGEKPFACELCGEKFSRSDVLLVHRRKHAALAQAEKNQPSQNTSQGGTSLQRQPASSNRTVKPSHSSQPHAATQLTVKPSNPDQNQQNSVPILHQDGRVGTVTCSLPSVTLVSPSLFPATVVSQVTVLPSGYEHM